MKVKRRSHRIKKAILYAGIAFIALLAVGAFLPDGAQEAHGQSSECVMEGFAWSGYQDGGAGWVAFDGGTIRVVADSNGDISGYAWADNIGWIKFGGLSGFPTGNGTTAENAKYNKTTGEITGWARACSVFASGCSGALKNNAYRGGWDGWISFSGNGYNVTWNSNNERFEGYAWGGDKVLGSISFAGSNYGVTFADPESCAPTMPASFDYEIFVDDVSLIKSEPQIAKVRPVIMELTTMGATEEVTVTDVSLAPLNSLPPGVDITIDINGPDSCSPSCTDVELVIDYDISSYEGQQDIVSYRVTTESISGVNKTYDFLIRIIGQQSQISCSADKSPVFIGDPVTWTVSTSGLPNPILYEWHGEELEGKTTTVPQITVTYSTTGSKTASVTIYYGPDCEPGGSGGSGGTGDSEEPSGGSGDSGEVGTGGVGDGNGTSGMCELETVVCTPIQVISEIFFKHI